MITDRFVRTIWAINGVIFLGFFVLVSGIALVAWIGDMLDNDQPNQVIVGEKLEQAKDKGLALQGISYSEPFSIYGSTGYVLPVHIRTYSDPKTINDSFDFGSREKLKANRDYYGYGDGNIVNIIFLDKNLRSIRTLLDRKAFINTFKYPSHPRNYADEYSRVSDTTIHHIIYKIAFEDSDKNGTIDRDDNSDLYISDLDGESLIKVSNNVTVSDQQFRTGNVIVFSYYKRDDLADEHKRKYFARYFIKEKRLEELTSIDQALNNIEAILTK